MEKIFFAFLDELAHSKQFKKSRENDLLLTPPPLVGKIPDNSGLFLEEGFPQIYSKTLSSNFEKIKVRHEKQIRLINNCLARILLQQSTLPL